MLWDIYLHEDEQTFYTLGFGYALWLSAFVINLIEGIGLKRKRG